MTLLELPALSRDDVLAAATLLEPHIRRTPLERAEALGAMAGCDLRLKLENLQVTGAFKIRGALNHVLRLTESERDAGVLTASAGNHGQGVAVAARISGVPACVVLPHGVPLAKLSAIQRAQAEVIVTGANYDESHDAARELARQRGAIFVHAYNDSAVIAGQGTVALEMHEDEPELDVIVVPLGGGGLLAGTVLALAGQKRRPEVIAVRAERPLLTIADGISVREPGDAAAAIWRDRVADVISVSDEEIARAIVLLLERHRLLAEGAGAAALAAVLREGARFAGKRVGVMVSGGNIDPNLLGKVLQQGLASAGRYLAFRTWLSDRPGMLHDLTGLLAAEHINILHVGIHRLGPYTSLGSVGLDVIVDTRDRVHADSVLELVRSHGFPVEEVLDTGPAH